MECFCLVPGLFELLLGVFSSVPVDWLGHGVVFLGWVLFDFSMLFVFKLFDSRDSFDIVDHCPIMKGFLMERVLLFSDDLDANLADAGVSDAVCRDIKDVYEYICLFYSGRCENASLDILGSDEVVVFWEDDVFSTSVVLGGFEKEARVESGETGSSLSLSSSGQLEWVLGSLGQMRRILSFNVC